MVKKTPVKRPAGQARSIKPRVIKACYSCRARKMRCDLIESISSCTNCRRKQVKCVFTRTNEGRGTNGRVHKIEHKESCREAPEETLCILPYGCQDFSEVAPWRPSWNATNNDNEEPNVLDQPHLKNVGGEWCYDQHIASNWANPMTMPLSTTPHKQLPALPPASNKTLCYSLPNYIGGLPGRLHVRDMGFLASKGALSIPEDGLRNELLKAYIRHVHPYMPLIDLEEFLRAIVQNDGVRQLSLLLFQAVMFAGIASIDLERLQAAGYPSRRVARKIFFQRARLLFDFDCEMDHISLIQSLLLMTYWDDTKGSEENTYHWMGVTVSLAHSIGLHRNPENYGMELPQQQMWKRVWWSLYARDRLIALTMRRPMHVNMDDCTVPLLTLDDFTLRPFAPECVRIVGETRLLQNIHYQRQLILIFIEKVKLCFNLGHVLSTQYTAFTHKYDVNMDTNVMLIPIYSSQQACEMHLCDQELESWLANVPTEAQYVPSNKVELEKVDEVLHSARALLRMIYLTTLIALHHPQCLLSIPFSPLNDGLWEMSATKLRSAAVEITKAIHDVHLLKLTRHHPTTFVTLLIPAVIIHLQDVKSSDPNLRMASLQRFYQCIRILQQLCDVHDSASLINSFLRRVIHTADIYLTVSQGYS